MGYDKNGNYDYTDKAAEGMFAPNYHARAGRFLKNTGQGIGCFLIVALVLGLIFGGCYGLIYLGSDAVSRGVKNGGAQPHGSTR